MEKYVLNTLGKIAGFLLKYPTKLSF